MTNDKTRKKSRKKRPTTLRIKRISQDDEDGTQVEMKTPAKTKRMRCRKKKTAPIDDPEAQAKMRQFCQKTLDAGIEGLIREFAALRAETSLPPPKSAFDANRPKNRYQDVYCGDATRVILKWPPRSTSDYIHANWVDFRGSKQLICTQGPTEATVDDFWRLVWQEKCKAIVMLCELLEQGQKKCEAYWPSEQDKSITTYSGLIIKNLSIIQTEEMMTVTQLTVSQRVSDGTPENSIKVKHVKWNNWPDRNVPKNKLAPFRLLARIQGLEPVLVHCSAGIGRTGTIVGLHMAVQVLEARETLSMPNIVKELRARRHGSVQTDAQYVYMHRSLIGLAENKNLVSSAEIEKFLVDYDKFTESRGRL